jgi:hypothetical protein
MRTARLKVSSCLLADALNLPEGTRITGAELDLMRLDTVVFDVVHEDLDDVERGQLIPQVDLVIKPRPRGEWVKYGSAR